MTAELLLECILSVLLIAACTYAFILSKRLAKIRQGQEELVEMIQKFDAAADTAKENLAGMKTRGLAMERDLAHLVKRANGLVSELSIMVNAGDNIAGRIEGAVAEVKTMGRVKTTHIGRAPTSTATKV